MRIWLGMTWMDSAKFLVLPFLLLIPPALTVYDASGRRGRLGKAGFLTTAGSLVLLSVGVGLEFWHFPWGSYQVGFEDEVATTAMGGVIQPLASLTLAVGLAMLTASAARGGVLEWWIVPVLVLGAIATFFLTPASWAPGVGWLILGLTLFKARRTA